MIPLYKADVLSSFFFRAVVDRFEERWDCSWVGWEALRAERLG